MLQNSLLPPGARDRAIAVFERLAIAEGRIHGIPPADVHFHEVGAIDSIVDIVATCLALEQLGITHLICGPLPLSTGTIHTEHGWIPLPAPATLALLEGWPVVPGRPGMEQVTPTGAALVAALATPGTLPSMQILGSGYGAGTKDTPDQANVLRVVMGDPIPASSPSDVLLIAANMDDFTGEHLPPLLTELMKAGALDAFASPLWMKKGRSGLLVQALAEPQHAMSVEAAMLLHGSTFGVRRHRVQRTCLDRRHETVETEWGTVRIKLGIHEGNVVHAAPEHEDVARIARKSGIPVPRVYAAAVGCWHQRGET